MKKQFTYLFSLFILFLASCEDDVDSPNDTGEDFIGTTFEFYGDFNQDNNFQLIFDFQSAGFLPYDSDVILAYILWESNEGNDYWRSLPQPVYLEDGRSFTYNFDFGSNISEGRILDMSVFIDGFADFNSLPPAFTENQTFRIVAVPSDFLNAADINPSDIESILNSGKIKMNELDIQIPKL
jgi:hypothetical protein